MNLIKSFLTNNPCYKVNKKITVKGLMLHSVGCPQPSALVFIKNWNKASYNRACVHAFIDGVSGAVYQCLPWNQRGWHCASGAKGSANNTHIGVEMCEPAAIEYTGGSTFTCSDYESAKATVKRTYNSAVELFAYLCKLYNLDPLADGVILSHSEAHKRGLASNHGDPEHLWKGLGMPYTMDTFRKDVKKAMGGGTTQKPTAPAKPSKPSCAYTGNSIVDYLHSIGKPASFAARKKYAAEYGIKNYKGTAAQNIALLNAMRGNPAKPSNPQNNIEYYAKYNGKSSSLDEIFKSIGVPEKFRGNWSKRKPIAEKNGIKNYKGTAAQNTQLKNLARSGKLRRV